jgi:hypothetical protein
VSFSGCRLERGAWEILGKMGAGEMGGGGCPSWCRGGWVSLMRSVPVVGGDGRCGLGRR